MTTFFKFKCRLKHNFELEAEGTVSRAQMYNDYINFCVKNNIEVKNNSIFGKYVKTIFGDLKTRRLGTESKYHYCGLRKITNSGEGIKQDSPSVSQVKRKRQRREENKNSIENTNRLETLKIASENVTENTALT